MVNVIMKPSKLLIISYFVLSCQIIHNVYSLSVSDLIDDLSKELEGQFGLENETINGEDYDMGEYRPWIVVDRVLTEFADAKLSKALDEVAKEILRSMSKEDGEEEVGDGDLLSDQSKERARRSESPHSTVVEAFKTSTDGISRLRGIHPLVGTCDHPIRLSVTNYNGMPVAACVSISPVPEIVIGELSLTEFNPRIRLQTIRSPAGATSFVDKDRLFVMVADAARPDGIDLHVITKTFGIKSEHVTSCHYPTAINVWKPSSDGPFHLAIANSPGSSLRPGSGNTYRNVTTFYKWTGTYFDSYTQVNSFNVKDICPFSVAGKDYVIIVNYESSPGFHSVDSELFKFDPDEYKWYSIQKIKTTGAVDCEIFSLGPDNNREFFLTIANNLDKDVTTGALKFNVDSVIYKFSNDKFVPFQCLKTVGATSIKAFEDSNEETRASSFVLAVAHMPGVQLFQYNGWKFVEAPVQLPRGSLGPGVTALTFTRLQQQSVLISVNPRMSSREPNVIRFDFVHENPLKNWKKSSHEWCDSVSSKINNGHSALGSINAILDDSFTIDQREPIIIKGDLSVTGPNLTVNGFLRAPAVNDLSAGKKFSHEMIAELDALNKQLLSLESQIASLAETLNRAVTLEGNQVITGQYSFNDADLLCKDSDRCVFGSINARSLNGLDISKLPISVVRTDRDQILSEDLVMEQVSVSGELHVEGAVNGVNPSKVVLKSSNQFIPSPKVFAGPTSATEVHVQGLINSAVINNRTILTQSGDQFVRSDITLKSGMNTPNLNVGRINGIELTRLLEDIVTRDGDHTIRGRKNFSSIRVSNLNLLPGGSIANVDLTDLWKNLMWTTGDQTIHAPLIFIDGAVASNLRAEKLINNMVIPNNDMVLVNRSAVITAAKTFSSPSSMVDQMSVASSINGIRKIDTGYSQWPDQLDILVQNYAQTFPAPRTFASGVHLSAHSSVQGLIDGVDVSRFAQMVLKRNSTNFMPGNWILTGDTNFESKVTVSGLVDGTNLTNLYWKSLKLTDKVIPNFAPFHFRALSSPQFKLRTLNRMVIERDLMTKNTRQIVVGVKAFPSGIQVTKNVTIIGLLNGIDMKFLADSLLRTGNQNIWGQKVIQGNVHVNNLIINRGVNGISLNDLVLINTSIPQVLTGKKTFNTVTVNGPLNATRVYVEKEMNGINVNDFFRGTMLFDEPQVVTGLKHYAEAVIPKGTNLDTNSVNGHNLKRIYWDAVLIDQPQTISGEKTFKNASTFDHLIFHRNFDGVTDRDLRYNWMLQGVNQVVNGNLVFNLGLSVNNNLFIADGTVNGIDLVSLNRTIVKKNEPAVINGQVTFARQLSVTGDVAVSGLTQGIKLSRDPLTRNSSCTVYGNKRFMSDVVLFDPLNANGLVNGIFIPELCSSAVRIVGDQVIRSRTLVRGHLNLERSLTTNGRIDGVNLNHFNMSAVKKNEPAAVYGRKRFHNLKAMSSITVQGTFGGLNLERLQSDYMSLTRDQVVNTPLIFANGIHFGSASVDGSIFTKYGLINNISLKSIDRNSLKLFGNQVVNGPIIFGGDVRVKGDLKFFSNRSIVNGVSLFESLFLKSRPQNVIQGSLMFDSNVEVKKNVDLAPGKGVQGVDVSEVARFMVAKSGNHTVDGHKHFASLEVDDIIVSGTVSGLNITPSNVLLASANQMIDGTVTFGKGLKLLSNLNANLINNVNLNTWTRRLVLNGYNNTIPARKSFSGPVSANQAWAMGLIDGVHLTSLRKNIYERFDTDQFRSHLSFQENKLKMLDQVLKNRAIQLDHYSIDRVLPETLLKSTEFSAKKFILTKQPGHGGCSKVTLYSVPSKTFSIVGSGVSFNPVLSNVFKIGEKTLVILVTSRVTDINAMRKCVASAPSSVADGQTFVQVLAYNPSSHKLDQISLMPFETAVTDIKIVSLSDHDVCLALASPFIKSPPTGSKLTDPRVICLNSLGKVVASYDKINGKGGNKLAVHVSPLVTMLAVSSVQSSFVNIVSWNLKTKTASKPLQNIHVTSPTCVAFVTTSIDEGNQVYLLIAGSSPQIIRVFKYIPSTKSAPFSEVQQISVSSSVVSVESVLLPDHSTVLFILFTNGEVKLYIYKGSSGFVPMMNVDSVAQKATSLSVIPTFTNTQLSGHVIAINRQVVSVYEDELDSETLLLSSVLTY